MKPQEMKDQMTTNTLLLDGERLLQIARDAGLRHHLRAVDSNAAGELLSRFAAAVISAHTPALLDAVDGAIAFGASGVNAPSTGHWLQRFWDIGRDQAAVRDQALQEAAAKMDARYNAVTGNQQYDKGRRDAYDVAESDILALKGTPAAAVPADESVCKGSMALGSGCGKCARCLAEITPAAAVADEVREAVSRLVLCAHNVGLAATPTMVAVLANAARDLAAMIADQAAPQPSSNPGPLAAVEASDTERLDWLAAEGCSVESSTLGNGPKYRVNWTLPEDWQAEWYVTPRAAIDAAIAASTAGKQEPT